MSVHSGLTTQSALLCSRRGGFEHGYTPITRDADSPCGAGVDFGIHRMHRGDEVEVGGPSTTQESVWVLLHGEAEFVWGSKKTCRVFTDYRSKI